MRRVVGLVSGLLFLIFPLQGRAEEGSATLNVPQSHSSLLLADANPSDLKVEDLGFDKETLKSKPEEAEALRVRTQKLQWHQIMGLATLGLMAATVATAPDDSAASNTHRNLGLATAVSYGTTAYLSLSAPDLPAGERSGWGMKIHRAMAFIHLPGMILTPIAGLQANKQIKDGKPLTGLAAKKESLAQMTYLSFAIAAVSVTFNF